MKLPFQSPRAANGKSSGANAARTAAYVPTVALRAGLALRTAALTLLEPLDYTARLLNGKRQFPPMTLRRYAGPLATLDASGAEFVAYLKLLCGAKVHSKILDIGCGFGLIALHLQDYLAPPGQYIGLDINLRAIRWAQKQLSTGASHLSFLHLDVRNGSYNPRGKVSAESVALPIPSQSFEIILLKSVFTHLRPPELANYMREVRRILTPNGVCLATFFLLNDVQRSCRSLGRNSIDFNFGDDVWRYALPAIPELAIAYSENYIHEQIGTAELDLREIYYGYWSGRADGLSYQDILILTPGGARPGDSGDRVET